MKRLICYWFGHENVWTLHPLHLGDPTRFIVTCLRCRRRAGP